LGGETHQWESGEENGSRRSQKKRTEMDPAYPAFDPGNIGKGSPPRTTAEKEGSRNSIGFNPVNTENLGFLEDDVDPLLRKEKCATERGTG